jgi:hypothetical protein
MHARSDASRSALRFIHFTLSKIGELLPSNCRGAMPATKGAPEQDRWLILTYIRSLGENR